MQAANHKPGPRKPRAVKRDPQAASRKPAQSREPQAETREPSYENRPALSMYAATTATAAGVTPGIRDACARVSGRTSPRR